MCIALLAWQSHPDYPLVLASNRDEFYARSTRPAAWWGQSVSLLAGRDEEAGGTWLGVNRSGRFALVTNVRSPQERNPHAPSRGTLVVAALQAAEPAAVWLAGAAERSRLYNGFNLLLGDALPSSAPAHPAQLHYFSNRREDGVQSLAPGIYGLSNAFLDTPWPKVTRSVARFACVIAQRIETRSLFTLLASRELARETELPRTGVPIDWERALSAVLIRANGYGTRASTVLTVRRDGLVNFVERTFDPANPERFADRSYEFVIPTANRVAGADRR